MLRLANMKNPAQAGVHNDYDTKVRNGEVAGVHNGYDLHIDFSAKISHRPRGGYIQRQRRGAARAPWRSMRESLEHLLRIKTASHLKLVFPMPTMAF